MFYSFIRVVARFIVFVLNGNAHYENKDKLPKGNYILCIIRIKYNEITRDYIYNPTESSNFRYDTSDYIIFYCINPEDYKISDFGFYNNTEIVLRGFSFASRYGRGSFG